MQGILMSFYPINYPQIVALTQQANKRQPRGFTTQEINQINQNIEQNPLLKALLIAYPPQDFIALRKRYYDQQRAVRRAEHRARGVHDEIFTQERNLTRLWLKGLPSSQEKPYSAPELATYKQQIQKHFQVFIEREAFKQRYSNQEESVKARRDFEAYIDEIFKGYQTGGTGPETLMYYMQWCQAGATNPLTPGQSEEYERFDDFFRILDDARNAYKEEVSKYYPPHDWSCMPGMEERLVDMLTVIKKSTQGVNLEGESIEQRYAREAANLFLGAENNRGLSEELYALYCAELAVAEKRTVRYGSLTQDSVRLAEFDQQIDDEANTAIAKIKAQFDESQQTIKDIKSQLGSLEPTIESMIDRSQRIFLTAEERNQRVKTNPREVADLRAKANTFERYLFKEYHYQLKPLPAIKELLTAARVQHVEGKAQEIQRYFQDYEEKLKALQSPQEQDSTELWVNNLQLSADPDLARLVASIEYYCEDERREFFLPEVAFTIKKNELLNEVKIYSGELPEGFSIPKQYEAFFDEQSVEKERYQVDEKGSVKLRDKDYLGVLSEKTGLSRDYLELIENLPLSGKGFDEFNSRLEAGYQPHPVRPVEETLAAVQATQERLIGLGQEYIRVHPGKLGIYLSWDQTIVEALRSYITQRPEDETLLIAQDRLLAEVAAGLNDRALRTKIFFECYQAGFITSVNALLSTQPGIDFNKKIRMAKQRCSGLLKEVMQQRLNCL
jgi:hypothetical protein